MLADTVGQVDRIISQDHQAEFIGQVADGGEVEVGQKDAFLAWYSTTHQPGGSGRRDPRDSG